VTATDHSTITGGRQDRTTTGQHSFFLLSILKFERNSKGTMQLMLLAVLIFAAVEVNVSTNLFYEIKIT
jgi:hypothetical protein